VIATIFGSTVGYPSDSLASCTHGIKSDQLFQKATVKRTQSQTVQKEFQTRIKKTFLQPKNCWSLE